MWVAVVNRTERQCHTETATSESSRVTGYNVTYRNEDGTTGTMRMASKPGNRIAMGTNDVVKGYNVTYRYDGAEKTVRMDNKPASDRLPVVDGSWSRRPLRRCHCRSHAPVIPAQHAVPDGPAHAGPFIVTGDIHPRGSHPPSWVPLRHGAGMSIFDLRIETERLILRPLLREDYEPYLAFCADEATMRTLGGVQPPSVAWRLLQPGWRLAAVRLLDVQRDREIQRRLDRADGTVAAAGLAGYRGWWGIRHGQLGPGLCRRRSRRSTGRSIRWAGEVIHTIAENNDARGRSRASWAARCCGELPPPYGASRCRSGASRASSGGSAR
jgi:hypothetical protein